jgi:hypothetical protein
VQKAPQDSSDNEALYALRAMVPRVAVVMAVGWISVVRLIRAMLVAFPLLGLPRFAMAIAVMGLSALPDGEDEFGDALDHSGSCLWRSSGMSGWHVAAGQEGMAGCGSSPARRNRLREGAPEGTPLSQSSISGSLHGYLPSSEPVTRARQVRESAEIAPRVAHETLAHQLLQELVQQEKSRIGSTL